MTVELVLQVLFALTLAASVGLAAWWTAGIGLQGVLGKHRMRQRLAGQAAGGNATVVDGQPTLLGGDQQSTIRQILGRFSLTNELESSLKQSFPDMSVERFLTICAACGGVVGFVMFAMRGSLLAGAIGFFAAGYVPFIWLARVRLKRQRQISEQLPDGLDFLGRSLRAGHSFPVGLQMMGNELPAPLCEEFGRCHDEMSLGTSTEDALKAMTDRIESGDFAFFVTAVLVQRQTGGDLAQVLDNITGLLRQRIQLANQTKAKTAEGRFTGYILAAFPMIMFVLLYLMSPDNTSILTDTFKGRCLLGAAIGLSVLGLIVIRKITAVKI
ncbi:MAG: type II secretion system F family protein [Planctomycetota bacterium]